MLYQQGGKFLAGQILPLTAWVVHVKENLGEKC